MFCGNRDLSAALPEWNGKSENSQKPLPLKQRTSSSTDRRDFTSNTWISLLELIKAREYFITVNHFSIWRRHNAWSMEDGKDLKAYITQRYASSMVFMSLLLSTEFGVLFNSATVTSQVRDDLVEAHWNTISFWAGLFIIVSALCTILSLISTFTFTAMISAIDEKNAHCILRSSIGQYATELPGRLIVGSIYSFLISFMSFFFLLLPVGYFSICLLLITVGFFVHVVSVFSSFGRIIMHTGAMSKHRIFSSDYEESLVPHSLHSNLLSKAKCNIANKISIIRQYRTKQRPIDRFLFEDELYDHLSGITSSTVTTTTTDASATEGGTNRIGSLGIVPNRLRADSKVRFADEEVGPTKTKKEVIEDSTEKTMNGVGLPTNGRHFRSLTPLSDISSVGSQHTTPDPDSIRSTIDIGISPFAVLPKKFFESTRRPPVVSTEFPAMVQRDTSAVSSMRTVSNASLEQWLQGSPTETMEKDEGSSSDGMSLFSGEPIDETGGKPSTGDSNVLPPPVPPKGSLALTTSSTSTWSSNRNDASKLLPKVNENHRQSDKGTLMRQKSIDSKPLLYNRRVDERELSEEERFIYDYGDFGSDSLEQVSYGTNRNATISSRVTMINVESGPKDQNQKNTNDGKSYLENDNERTKLLR